MRRRSVISIVGGVTLGARFPALAQQSRKVPLVVDLGINPLVPGEKEATIDWVVKGLRNLGYVEGKDVVCEYRHAGGNREQLAALIESQIKDGVDVICSATPEVLLTAMRITRTVPIVFISIGDPVGAGLVDSLAKPGRNITGLSFDSGSEFGAKQFDLLRQTVPGNRPYAVLWNPKWETSPDYFQAIKNAARASKVTLEPIEVYSPADLEPAFDRMAKARVQAVLIVGSGFTWIHKEELARLAAKHRLPATGGGGGDAVRAGALMSYGPNIQDMFFRTATYVHKILKGAKPADLPVEQPVKFDFLINLKTAKALGLTIPQAVLLQATEVIE